MIFIYNRNLAMKYILFALFIILVIILTLPTTLFIPMIVVDIALVWIIIGLFLRSYELMTKKIIVSEEGISFYKGKDREKTIPWNIVDNNSLSNQRIVLKVEGTFFYVTNEIQNFHLLHRLLSQHLFLPIKERGKGLPKRAELEQIKDVKMIKVSRDYSAFFADKQGMVDQMNPKDIEMFGDGQESSEEIPMFEDTGRRYDFPDTREYSRITDNSKILPRTYIPPDEKLQARDEDEELETFGAEPSSFNDAPRSPVPETDEEESYGPYSANRPKPRPEDEDDEF